MPIAMLITGFLVEEVSEKEFQEYLKQKIFSPLRMDDSFTIAHSRDSAQNRQLNLMILDGRKLQYDN